MISNACQSYYSNQIPHEYPSSLEDLIEPNSVPPYIDVNLASGEKQGYLFEYSALDDDIFSLNANPKTPGKTGVRYFYVDETGVIRSSSEGEAGIDNAPVSG